MIARLRRHRWLAVLLLLCSPALAGQAMPVLHPCAVDAPWMASAHTMAGMTHGASHGGAQHHACTCIGCYAAPALLDAPTPQLVTAEVEEPRHQAWPVIESGTPTTPLVDRLPPSTAPPLA